MAFIRSLFTTLFVFFSFMMGGTEYAPWFAPPFEFQGRVSYLFTHANHVTTPKATFASPTNNVSLHGSLQVTPWPFWNVEGEIYVTHTQNVAFSYEAAWLTIRYAWLDDIAGDVVSLVTGATFSIPGSRFLHAYSFPYHGRFNTECHATLGKEWDWGSSWRMRLWGLAGIGCAEKGSPWIHGILNASYQIFPQMIASLFAEALFGLGNRDIPLNASFPGYAAIAHHSILLGACVHYEIPYWATLSFCSWYAPYTENFIGNPFGWTVSTLIPFSIF